LGVGDGSVEGEGVGEVEVRTTIGGDGVEGGEDAGGRDETDHLRDRECRS
jgi:hypothetical protein